MRWLLVAILSLIATASHANELLKIEKAAFTSFSVAATNPVFTALHTFFIAPASGGGSDSNNGTSAGSPWLTPNHSGLVCGDVIIAATGAYSSASFDSLTNGSSLYGTVSSCPSTSGGNDGTGGVQTVTMFCGNQLTCTINGSTQWAMLVDKSHWAIEGFQVTNNTNGSGGCLTAAPNISGAAIGYVAFVDNVSMNCALLGIGAQGLGPLFNGVDEFAAVGNVAFNAAQSASECGSGFADNVPSNFDALADVHKFYSQNFAFGNINGPCSLNSDGFGAFPTASSAASAGASSIVVSAVSGWGVGAPIGASSNGVTYPSSSTAIVTTGATPTLVSSVAGTTVGLSSNVASPGIANTQQLGVGTSTDGEGLIFDTWAQNGYTGKSVVENNLFWGNGGYGMEFFCGGVTTCNSALTVIFTLNTSYGSAQDYKHDGDVFEFTINTLTSATMSFSLTNNIYQASLTKPANSTTFAAWNGTTGVGAHGTGQHVNAADFGQAGLTITGNFFKSAAGATCPTVNTPTCSGTTNDIVNYGTTYGAGNTLGTDAGFASPGSLPTTFTGCAGFANVNACMAATIAAMVPSASGTSGKGYQPVGPCAPDANYPRWLKGIVYLSWDGTKITEQSGLITKPCGL